MVRFHFLRLRFIALGGTVTATDIFAHTTECTDEQLGLWMALNNDDLRKSLLPMDH